MRTVHKGLVAFAVPLALWGCSSKPTIKTGLWRLTDKGTGLQLSGKTGDVPAQFAAGSDSATSTALCWAEKDAHSFRGMMSDTRDLPKVCTVVKDRVADGKIDFEIDCKNKPSDRLLFARKVNGTYTPMTLKVLATTTITHLIPGKTTSLAFKSEVTAERVGECKG